MANRGNSRHLKSLVASKFMQVHKKEQVYTMKPVAGRHSLQRSITLLAFARRVGAAQTGSDAKKMIKRKEMHVNGRAVREPAYPLGLNDFVTVVPSKANYTIGINERGQVSIKESKGQIDERLCRVVQKFKATKGKIMFRLHDGTVLHGNNEIGANDSIVLDTENHVKRVLKLGSGSKCMVIEGVHVGSRGTVKEIKKGSSNVQSSVMITQENSTEFETLLKNIMAVE